MPRRPPSDEETRDPDYGLPFGFLFTQNPVASERSRNRMRAKRSRDESQTRSHNNPAVIRTSDVTRHDSIFGCDIFLQQTHLIQKLGCHLAKK